MSERLQRATHIYNTAPVNLSVLAEGHVPSSPVGAVRARGVQCVVGRRFWERSVERRSG